MKVYIESYFSRDSSCFDGFYEVEIPENHKETYKDIISTMGKILDTIRCEYFDSVEEFIDNGYEENPFIGKIFIKSNWDRLTWTANRYGSTLEGTLYSLTWQFKEVCFEKYDADFCKFDW